MYKYGVSSTVVFKAVDSTDGVTAKTGLTSVTLLCYISKDGGAFTPCTNAFSEISRGWYKLVLTATEMQAESIAIDFTATGAIVAGIPIHTEPDYTATRAGYLTGDAFARLGAPAGASVSADIAAVKAVDDAVKAKTDSLTFTVAGVADANVVDWKGATAPAMTGDAYARIGAAGAGLTALGDARIAHLDADVSSRLASGTVASDVTAIKAKTDNLPAAPADETLIIAATTSIMSRLGAPVGASISADIAGVQADTDDLQTRIPSALVSGRIDASVGAMAADVVTASAIATDAIGALEIAGGAASEIATAVRTELATELGRVDVAVSTRLATGTVASDVTAIKANTDNLPSDPADESLVIAATDAIMARIGAPAGASVSADVAAVKTDTAAVKTQTDKLTFTVPNQLDANIQSVNDVTVHGTGAPGDTWGP